MLIQTLHACEMLRSLRTCVPSLRTWHHTAVFDSLALRGTLPFSTGLSLRKFAVASRLPMLFCLLPQHCLLHAEVTGQVVELTTDKEYADALSAIRGALCFAQL